MCTLPPTSDKMGINSTRITSLDETVDSKLQSKVFQLAPLVPEFNISFIRDVLLTYEGNIEAAGAFLVFGDDSDVHQRSVNSLMKKYPQMTEKEVRDAFFRCHGDCKKAAILLQEREAGPCLFVDEEGDHKVGLERKEGLDLFVDRSENQKDAADEILKMPKKGKHQYYLQRQPTILKSRTTNTHIIGKPPSREDQVDFAHNCSKKVKDVANMIGSTRKEDDAGIRTRAGGAMPKSFNNAYSPRETSFMDRAKSSVPNETFDSGAKILYTAFGGEPLFECENSLQACGNDVEDAFRKIGKDYGLKGRQGSTTEGRNPYGGNGIAGPSSDHYEASRTSGSYGLKRANRRLDQYPVKKVKAQHNNEQFDMDTESGEDSGNDQGSGVSEIDDEQRAGPEPASEWIAICYPSGEKAVILLGPEEEIRDTLPVRMLCSSSGFFQDHFDRVSAGEVDDKPIKLPEVHPQLFDLVIQCLVCKNLTLQPGLGKSKSISVLLDVIFVALKLGFPDPGKAVVDLIRNILISNRGALRRTHVQKSFTLRRGHEIQKLFVKAAVQEYMKVSNDDDSVDEIPSSDEDPRDDAHLAFTQGLGFRFHGEVESNHAFKRMLQREQDIILKSAAVVEVKRGSAKKPAITSRAYTDPLDGSKFFL